MLPFESVSVFAPCRLDVSGIQTPLVQLDYSILSSSIVLDKFRKDLKLFQEYMVEINVHRRIIIRISKGIKGEEGIPLSSCIF
jgi:hypothetical protein